MVPIITEIYFSRPYAEIRETPDFGRRADSITIVTLNAGLLDVSFFGITVLKPADFVEQRFAKLAELLLTSGADIIALQEIYSAEHQNTLLGELEDIYPYSFRKKTSLLRLDNGLLVLSRFPIVKAEMHRMAKGPWEESVFSSKYLMATEIAIDARQTIDLINLHATSGGIYNLQDAPDIIALREGQILQASTLRKHSSNNYRVILGDFNAGPEIAASNYLILESQGYVDVYKNYSQKTGIEPQITWDSKNILNIHGTHADSISQRIDHIFISASLYRDTDIVAADVLWRDPIIIADDNSRLPLSDHYGVAVELDLRRK